MGCTASKLDNEDTVRRCKERRRLIKEAVYARHHLAAAHFDYCRSLRATGSALSEFAAGEPLSVSDSTPAVLLRNLSKSNSNSFSLPTKTPPLRSAAAPSPAPSSIRPPPPPSPYSPPSSSSPTIASSKLPPILSAASSVHSSAARTRRRNDPKPKIPHILSDSSLPATPAARPADKFGFEATYAAQPATPSSQASSVWNWENFYPPSPPDSEFFYNRHRDDDHRNQTFQNDAVYFPKEDPHHHLDVDSEQEQEQREEVHCSEWGDHYSTSTSTTSESEPDADGDDERETARSEISDAPTASNFGSSTRRNASSMGQDHHHRPPSPHKYKGAAMGTVDEESEKDASPSVGWEYRVPGGGTGDVSDMRMVVRHRDLKEIVASIRDYFDKAAAAGDQVAEILETGRAQLDRSFRQLKKTVYHSTGVFTNLSSTWSSKPPLAVKYKLDAALLDEPAGGSKSLCSTLERLLAWEKKLYDEVKDREGVKIAHEKKLKTLQSQEYKGEDEAKLDKTKTSIKRLQSLIIVTSQAVNTTSSAIVGLRDNDLVPQLIELCHGLLYMWRSMNQSHEFQNQVVQQVRGLVNQSLKGHSTSELHRQATRDLESAVASWHSSFCRFVQHQRDFIFSLHGWFNLTLLPVDSEVTNLTTTATGPTEAFSFFDEWKLSLNRLPDKVASEAIKSFVNVVHVISTQQTEEIKMKRKTETASKELEKKASALRNIERKYYHSYSTVGLGLPNNGPDRDGQVLDARDPLAEKKAELSSCQRKVEEEILKHTKAVEVTRAMTLNNLQTGLPGVFQAMTSFSSLYVEAMETVCTRSYGIK